MIISRTLNALVIICVYVSISAEIQNCTYLDTVELIEGDKLQNGSYMYEGVLIPPELIGEYDYELRYGDRIERLNHTRGCVCKLKPCIRLCCHPSATIDENGECKSDAAKDLNLNPFINITYTNGSTQIVHVLDEFVTQRGLPCPNVYVLSSEQTDQDNWELFENGTLVITVDGSHHSKQDYCMHPSWHDIYKKYVFKPHSCPILNTPSTFRYIISIIMFISVIFFILTILVFLFTPQLQNMNGKCQICYLAALAVSFTMINLNVHFQNMPIIPCYIVGFVGYFFTISAFAWSSVISFDIWNTFRLRHNTMRPNAIFGQYNLIAWGCGAFLTFVIFTIDMISDVEGGFQSGIGTYGCWVTTSFTMPKIYLYGPMVIMLIFNITMFILSAKKINDIKRTLEQSDVREEHAKRLSSNRKMYSLFLRLFFIMGIVWILELFSAFSIENPTMEIIHILTDCLSASQGVIMFLLMILRPKIRRAILGQKKNAANRDESSDEGFSLQEKTIALSTLN